MAIPNAQWTIRVAAIQGGVEEAIKALSDAELLMQKQCNGLAFHIFGIRVIEGLDGFFVRLRVRVPSSVCKRLAKLDPRWSKLANLVHPDDFATPAPAAAPADPAPETEPDDGNNAP